LWDWFYGVVTQIRKENKNKNTSSLMRKKIRSMVLSEEIRKRMLEEKAKIKEAKAQKLINDQAKEWAESLLSEPIADKKKKKKKTNLKLLVGALNKKALRMARDKRKNKKHKKAKAATAGASLLPIPLPTPIVPRAEEPVHFEGDNDDWGDLHRLQNRYACEPEPELSAMEKAHRAAVSRALDAEDTETEDEGVNTRPGIGFGGMKVARKKRTSKKKKPTAANPLKEALGKFIAKKKRAYNKKNPNAPKAPKPRKERAPRKPKRTAEEQIKFLAKQRENRLGKALQASLKKLRESERKCVEACKSKYEGKRSARHKKFHKTRKNPSQMSAETKAKIKKYWADRKFKIANNLPLAFAKPKKGHIGRR